MRTTLNIEDDVLMAVKEIAQQRGLSVGEVLSELARKSLQQPVQEAGTRNSLPLFPVQPEAGVVTLELINRLRDETE